MRGSTWRGPPVGLGGAARGSSARNGLVRLLFVHRADRQISRRCTCLRPAFPARVNETHDPARPPGWTRPRVIPTFPFRTFLSACSGAQKASGPPSVGVAIGDQILDLGAISRDGRVFGAGRGGWSSRRRPIIEPAHGCSARITGLRSASAQCTSSRRLTGVPRQPRRAERLLVPMAEAELLLPAQIGDYTDFYASVHHATNVGSMFRPDNPLLPNYKWVPIGYHGRASSIVPSGTPVRRPRGQIKDPNAEAPVFAPSRALDYEMEVGCFVGPGNAAGRARPDRRCREASVRACVW